MGHLQVVTGLSDQLYRNAWGVVGEFWGRGAGQDESLQYYCHAYKCDCININMSFHLAIVSGFGDFKPPTTARLAGMLKSTVKCRVSAVGEFKNLGVLQCCQPFYARRTGISVESMLLIKLRHFVVCMIYLSATRCVFVKGRC